jgi:hypothetical protein
MNSASNKSVRSLGLWSAVLCTVFSLSYVVAQLGEWAGLLGSDGGPHSQSTTLGLIVLLTPSLFLGITFVVLMVSIHYQAEPGERVWSHAAIVFAAMYATLISIVYYVQLAFVMPRLARGDTADIQLLLFEPFDSFLYRIWRPRPRALDTPGAHRERLSHSVPCAADVLPAVNLGRRTLGYYISKRNLAAGDTLQKAEVGRRHTGYGPARLP